MRWHIAHSSPTHHPIPIPFTSPFPLLLISFSQRNRRHRIQRPSHLIRRHLTVLQTPHLTPLPQSLQPERQFPALRFVDEKDVFLAICVADRGAEDVEVFLGLETSLFVVC